MSIKQYINWGTIAKGGLQVALYLLLGLALALFISRPVHAAGLDCPPPYYPYCHNEQYNYPYDNGNEETENGDNGNSYPDNGSNGYNGNGDNGNGYPDNGDYGYNGDNGYNDLPPVYDPTGWLVVTSLADNTGQRLAGTVFEIRRALGDELVTTVSTDLFGEVGVLLPVGNYFLRAVAVQYGFILDGARHNFSIHDSDITFVSVRHLPLPPNEPDPPPLPPDEPPAQGRLLVTSRAHGTGELLQGVVFEVRRAMDDMFVAQLVTNQFGEASVHLPVGDYFIRTVAVPTGFILDTNRISARIQADRLTEINVTHRPIAQEPEPTPAPTEPPPAADGRLLIINRAQAERGQGTGQVLSGTIFEVRSTMDDRLITQLQTNQFGEVTFNLPAGDYFIRQISPAAGFVLDSSRTNIRIVSGELLTVTVLSTSYVVEVEEEEPETPQYGRLLVTLMSGATGERIIGGTITIHDVMTDELVITLTSDFFGETSIFLPAGRYFMRQASMPYGYLTNLDRIPFTVNAGDITDMALAIRAVPAPPTPAPTPTPPAQPAAPVQPVPLPTIETIPDSDTGTQSRIEIVTRAAGSGNPLSGGIFAVYRFYDNRRIAELTTGADGRAYLMVEQGMHFVRELRPTFGFLLEPERIFLEVGEGEIVIMELTKLRDYDIAYLPMDVEGGGIIYIPQTGQRWPTGFFVGGGILLLISFIAAGFLTVFLIHVRGRD